jgi:RNA polymerase sigma factor (sigma-70 family)
VGDAPAAPDEEAERSASRDRVRRALAGLRERDRMVLLLREEGFSHSEIAQQVGTTTGSVGTMIVRALDRLAAELKLDPEHTE